MTLNRFDLRDVFKALRHAPGYTLTVTLTLALTIGATTAVFSIVNGVLLKPLAYRESHRLVDIRETWQQYADRLSAGDAFAVNAQHFEYWRAHARSFESMGQFVVGAANLTGAGEAAELRLVRASGSLFDVLQVPAALGRSLTPDDEDAGRPAVVVLSDRIWRERFGGDPSLIGRPIALDGRPHVVVGVLPAGFRLPDGARLTDRLDAFVPMRMTVENVGWVGDHNNAAIARLKSGVTPEQAQAELNVLQTQVSARATDEAHEPVTLGSVVGPLTERIVGTSRRGLLLLLGAIGAVLLIACSNLANLSLTRTMARQREAAIRAALGASRARLATTAVVEQAILAVAGGALGLGVARAALALFVRTAPIDLPRANEVTLDARVLTFAAGLSILVSLLVSILPALRTVKTAVQPTLRAGGLATTGDPGATRTRSVLLAAQIAMSVTLLVVTGLLVLSFMRLVEIDRGFNADRVLAVSLSMPAARYADGSQRLATYDRLLAAVHDVPGVESATTASMMPMAGWGQTNPIVPDGDARPKAQQPTANFRFIGPEYFRTLGIPILHGRSFRPDERDPHRPTPILISEQTAARLWPGQDAVGRRCSRGFPQEQGFEVVGVVAEARTTTIDATPPLMVYVPYWWRSRASLSILIKTAVDPLSVMPAVRRAVRAIDPDIAIGEPRTLETVVTASFAGRAYQTRLFVAFGATALAIAALGVYAVTVYSVSRRRREMNIRVALGAPRSRVTGMIVRQAGMPVAMGIAAGVAGALAIGGVVSSLLFDVQPREPLVMGTVVGLVAAIGLAACLIATRQGLVIDPARALREE